MLAKSVEGFVIRREKLCVPRPSAPLVHRDVGGLGAKFTFGHGECFECLAALGYFVEQRASLHVAELNASSLLVDSGFHSSGLHHDGLPFLADSVARALCLCHNHQALLLAEGIIGRCLHANNLVAHYLQPHLAW